MELKKNKKYDLEHRRPMFFGIGMVITLSLTLVAFEWKSPIDPIVHPKPTEEIPWFIVEEPKVNRYDVPKLPQPKVEKQVISAAVIIKEVEELSSILETEDPAIDAESHIDDIISSEPMKEEISENPFIVVEDMPIFPGGDAALLSFISKNIRYPKSAQRMGIEGKVYLSFVIDKDGSITDIQVLRGIGAGCDKEAIRVLKLLPNFSPGKQRGIPVKVQMQIPVDFQLR